MTKNSNYRITRLIGSIICLSFSINSPAQNLMQALDLRCNNYAQGNAVTADANGNIYACGGFVGSLDINPSTGVYNLSNPDLNYNQDIFVSKFNSTGNLEWGFSLGTQGIWERVTDMLIDDSANIYISGCIYSSIDFDPGPGTHILNPTIYGGNGFFLAKYDSAGHYVWGFTICSSNTLNIANGLAFDPAGYLVVTGSFGDSADFDPSSNVAMITTTSPYANTFVAKYTTNGEYVWAFMYGFYPSITEGDGIAIDDSSNIYIVGKTNDSTDLDPGPGVYYLPTGGYLGKYDPSGNFLWAYGIQSGSQFDWTEVAIDHDGNILIGGGFQGSIDVDLTAGVYPLNALNGFYDCFLAKYDASANLLWAFNMGGSGNGIGEGIYDITVDAANSIYVSGMFFGAMDADPGSGVNTLSAPSVNEFSGFVGRYTAAGDLDFAFTTGADCPSVYLGQTVFYVTGAFFGTRDFAPGATTYNMTAQAWDCYVSSYDYTITAVPETPGSPEASILIYPNPARNQFVIDAPENIDVLTIYEMTGRLIYRQTLHESKTPITVQLLPGMYLVETLAKEKTCQQRVVVE